MKVVFDTSIMVAAAHSRRGASFALVSSIPSERFAICLSVALYLEWQDVLTRPEHIPPGRSADEVRDFLGYLCGQADHHAIYFRWRPFLPDPADDMILELAVAASCRYVVTHNVRHFAGSESFGVEAVTAGDFLRMLKQGAAP